MPGRQAGVEITEPLTGVDGVVRSSDKGPAHDEGRHREGPLLRAPMTGNNPFAMVEPPFRLNTANRIDATGGSATLLDLPILFRSSSPDAGPFVVRWASSFISALHPCADPQRMRRTRRRGAGGGPLARSHAPDDVARADKSAAGVTIGRSDSQSAR